ncbi:hypothetical protein DsansV1_C19g0156231 [Dioscorea sansibarensis]
MYMLSIVAKSRRKIKGSPWPSFGAQPCPGAIDPRSVLFFGRNQSPQVISPCLL